LNTERVPGQKNHGPFHLACMEGVRRVSAARRHLAPSGDSCTPRAAP
jgi:hypothetical protein